MLSVLEDRKEIDQAQTLFEKKLANYADKTGEIFVGYQGGNQLCTASWNEEVGFWWVNEPISNRFWNAFGTDEPDWNSSYGHIIDCEINPPFEGINRIIAGVFAKDENGNLFLLHRGRIGGGRPGIGKNLFLNNYSEELITVKDGNQFSNLALVGSFKDPTFLNQVANFVKEVKRIKLKAANNQTTILAVKHGLLPVFNKEFSGKSKLVDTNNQLEKNYTHGLIVNTLEEKFKSKGITAGNSREIDLFTIDADNNLASLFEVKTDATTTSIYGAIGQLYYNSRLLNVDCSLVAVLPKTLEKKTRKILNELSIQCLTYEWFDGKPSFNNFDARSFI